MQCKEAKALLVGDIFSHDANTIARVRNLSRLPGGKVRINAVTLRHDVEFTIGQLETIMVYGVTEPISIQFLKAMQR